MESENKTRIYILFLATLLLFSVAWLSVSYRDTYLTLWATKNNFQEKINYRMKFVFLDYMSDEQVVLCEDLYNHLKANSQKLKFIKPNFIFNINKLSKQVNPSCEDNIKLSGPYKIYDLDDKTLFLMGKNESDSYVYQYIDKTTCLPKMGLEDRKLVVSKNNAVVEVYGKNYLISEWFAKDKFVFFYLDEDKKYNELVCRFDVVAN
ncbi:MAG: hypothetical protein ACK5N8_07585 [Alphaproteobacteria bacterium]